MDLLTNGFHILLIILGFGVLIFIHELGHFLAAKWANIRTEAFAVGMGPVVVAWRKGIGFRFGSTAAEYERRVREFLATDHARAGAGRKITADDLRRIGDKLGLGETEYSLRWLPIGGFVKMLGQEDANPNYVSDDPRSYNRCPIGKRMVVVSAGVVANLILAVVLFIAAFMAGVKFEAPVVGDVSETLAAGTTWPEDYAERGVTRAGLVPGDRIVSIDGEEVKTFADVQIAAAMSRPGEALDVRVERTGFDQSLRFELQPQKDKFSGLLGIGILPASSNELMREEESFIAKQLRHAGLWDAGVRPGMRLIAADGREIEAYQQLERMVDESDGRAVRTTWTRVDKRGEPVGEPIGADLPVFPEFQALLYPFLAEGGVRDFEQGLIGLVPLVRIQEISAESHNAGVFREGDVILRAGAVIGPRLSELPGIVEKFRNRTMPLLIERDGGELTVEGQVDREGRLGIVLAYAHETPVMAQPLERLGVRAEGREPAGTRASAIADLQLLPLTRIEAINGEAVMDWASLRAAIRKHVSDSSGAALELAVAFPTPGSPTRTFTIELAPEDVEEIRSLAWTSRLPSFLFQPIFTERHARGNPLAAVRMGFEETYKLVILTYLTIDRLVRGSVGVEQLRGPVGIVHIGAKVADRGFTYLIFFLAMISVNLAVINFLPLPIVDGGLFLFLVYEKIKGRPPSLAFQNLATVVGLCLIITAFAVTFYNDIMRLIE